MEPPWGVEPQTYALRETRRDPHKGPTRTNASTMASSTSQSTCGNRHVMPEVMPAIRPIDPPPGYPTAPRERRIPHAQLMDIGDRRGVAVGPSIRSAQLSRPRREGTQVLHPAHRGRDRGHDA